MRCRSSGFDQGLVLGRERVVGFLVHIQVQLQAALPPARVVIIRRDLVEAQLLVVVRAYPFGRVNAAFFKRLVNLPAGKVLRYAAQALYDFARKATDTELQALHVRERPDLLAEPAAHLRACIAAGES